MEKNGEVSKVDQTEGGIGRPSDVFAYNRHFRHFLCIALYKDDMIRIEVSVADALGTIVYKERSDCHTLQSGDVERLVDQWMEKDPLIRAIGIGIPGIPIDHVIRMCDIRELEQVNFVQIFRERYGVDVVVLSDIDLVTDYLYHRHQPSYPGDFAVIHYPAREGVINVECGAMVNGHLLRGNCCFPGKLDQITEVFGIPVEEQRRMLHDREEFRRLVSLHLMMVCGTLDPADVVLMGNGMQQDDVEEIRQRCLAAMPNCTLPKVACADSFYPCFVDGLLRRTLALHLFRFTASNIRIAEE